MDYASVKAMAPRPMPKAKAPAKAKAAQKVKQTKGPKARPEPMRDGYTKMGSAR